LLNAFAKRELGSYWFSTGTPTFLVNYLKEAHYFIPDLDGNVELNESELQIYRAVAQDTLPILFQAGYLTIKEYISDLKLYRLGFPNDEVRYGFLENLLPAYSDVPFGQTGVWIGRFVQDIRKGNVEGFMERLYTACAGLPYSMAAKKNTKMRERDYQIAFYILFTLMGQFTQAEVVSVRGRSDCVVYTQSTIYVFEFKLAGSGTAQEAIEQIKEKGYAEPYRKSGKKVVLVGAIFGDGIDEDTPDTWIAEKWG
ncbi:MAG: PD-(D/E)XK nuclease domain-containing protein, partial [Treponema sp.]